jgi:hypothetical protein
VNAARDAAPSSVDANAMRTSVFQAIQKVEARTSGRAHHLAHVTRSILDVVKRELIEQQMRAREEQRAAAPRTDAVVDAAAASVAATQGAHAMAQQASAGSSSMLRAEMLLESLAQRLKAVELRNVGLDDETAAILARAAEGGLPLDESTHAGREVCNNQGQGSEAPSSGHEEGAARAAAAGAAGAASSRAVHPTAAVRALRGAVASSGAARRQLATLFESLVTLYHSAHAKDRGTLAAMRAHVEAADGELASLRVALEQSESHASKVSVCGAAGAAACALAQHAVSHPF